MVTFPGPCMTPVGEGIGVIVDVGATVAVLVAVEYLMTGKDVGVCVEFGSGVRTVPVHADNKNKTPTNTFILFIIPSILIGDDSDPRECANHRESARVQ